MVTDQQVHRLRQKLMEKKKQETAAAAAGMSVRTARTWQRGLLPSEKKKDRYWRTRPDPFEEIWESDIEPLLRRDTDGILQATIILEHLQERYPDKFSPGQVRTLQRRLKDWRAINGPDREIYFPQDHPPGREAQIDFTHGEELLVTINGIPYSHLIFEFILSYSGWRYVDLAGGETLESLVSGLQGAVWELGGSPEVVRSDNLSAATHELKQSKGRTLTERYKAVLDHYNIRSTRTNVNSGHENGKAEQAHYRLKSAIIQELILRGSRDFSSKNAYLGFIREIVNKHNRRFEEKLREEKRFLKPLPPAPVPEYTTYRPKVSKWGIIRVACKTYTVPSRLKGLEVEVRQYAGHLEVYYNGHLIEEMERLHGVNAASINYRHVIHSLVRKPGAFARYRFREYLFPTQTFRMAYDALGRWRGERADVEYVRILHLAATSMESEVEGALSFLLQSGELFDYQKVKELVAPLTPSIPELSLGVPDLSVYDALLAGGVR